MPEGNSAPEAKATPSGTHPARACTPEDRCTLPSFLALQGNPVPGLSWPSSYPRTQRSTRSTPGTASNLSTTRPDPPKPTPMHLNSSNPRLVLSLGRGAGRLLVDSAGRAGRERRSLDRRRPSFPSLDPCPPRSATGRRGPDRPRHQPTASSRWDGPTPRDQKSRGAPALLIHEAQDATKGAPHFSTLVTQLALRFHCRGADYRGQLDDGARARLVLSWWARPA